MSTIRTALSLKAWSAATTLALVLQGCASPGPGPGPARGPGTVPGPPPAAVRQPVRQAPRDPQLKMVPGLEGIIGASEAQLTRQFGEARLDVREGDARKLQFTGTPCVLDIYLYPTSQSPEPIATYVEARRSSDGAAVDRVSCVKALRGR